MWFNSVCFLGYTESKPAEALNKKALAIVTRVREKLTGRDFIHKQELTIPRQVDLLIQQATAIENLCQCYIGWYGCIKIILTTKFKFLITYDFVMNRLNSIFIN